MKKLLLFLILLLFTNNVYAKEVELKTKTGTIYGTLELPASKKPVPLVIFVSGSGPTDRDGNSALVQGKCNSLKYLASALLKNNIASLRFDKRGVAKSGAAISKEDNLTIDVYVNDLVLWFKLMKKNKKFSKIIIAGHSEGSLIGILASEKIKTDGFISIAGVGKRASDLLIEQFKRTTPISLLKQAEKTIKKLEAGQTDSNPPKEFAAFFRPSIQPYLISWFKYDPAKEISKLKIPILILQGTTDIQVTVNDAKLLADANKKTKLVILEGVNHVLKKVGTDLNEQIKSYGDADLPVDEELITAMVDFVNEVIK